MTSHVPLDPSHAAAAPEREREGRAVGPAVERLRAAVPDLWDELGPMCVACSREEADAVAHRLHGYLAGTPHADHASELSNELLALHAGWAHFTGDQRAALHGAMAYLVSEEDCCPDHGPGGLDDDDRVVQACVRAVLRPAA